jgi:hypothetical protein
MPIVALFYGYLRQGAQLMGIRTDVPTEINSVVQAIIFCWSPRRSHCQTASSSGECWPIAPGEPCAFLPTRVTVPQRRIVEQSFVEHRPFISASEGNAQAMLPISVWPYRPTSRVGVLQPPATTGSSMFRFLLAATMTLSVRNVGVALNFPHCKK